MRPKKKNFENIVSRGENAGSERSYNVFYPSNDKFSFFSVKFVWLPALAFNLDKCTMLLLVKGLEIFCLPLYTLSVIVLTAILTIVSEWLKNFMASVYSAKSLVCCKDKHNTVTSLCSELFWLRKIMVKYYELVKKEKSKFD